MGRAGWYLSLPARVYPGTFLLIQKFSLLIIKCPDKEMLFPFRHHAMRNALMWGGIAGRGQGMSLSGSVGMFRLRLRLRLRPGFRVLVLVRVMVLGLWSLFGVITETRQSRVA